MFVAFECDTESIYRVNNFVNDSNVKGNNNNDKKISDLLTKLQLKDKNNNNVNHQIIDENSFVGYLYSEDLEDGVIILPKIYKGKNDNLGIKIGEDSKTINFNSKEDSENFSQFISDLCATLRRFKDRNPNGKSSTKNYEIESKVFSPGENNEKTLLEIEDSLIDFHKKNKYLFTQIALSKINKSHKINWTKTVTNKQPLIQNKKVVYPELYTQKKEIDYKEELIVLFYSVLDYLKQRTHRKHIEKAALNYKLLSIEKIEQFRKTDKGINYLKSIRSQYFSDRLVKLWKLLYAYFSKVYNLKNNKNKHKDYLLVNNFQMVFEDMVEQLIGSSNKDSNKEINKLKNNKIIDGSDDKGKYKLVIPEELKDKGLNENYKYPDHLFLLKNEITDYKTLFLLDSKYRKEDKVKELLDENNLDFESDLGKQVLYEKILYKKLKSLTSKNEIKINKLIIPNIFVCPKITNEEKFFKYSYSKCVDEYHSKWLCVMTANFEKLMNSYLRYEDNSKQQAREEIREEFNKKVAILIC